MSPRPDVSEERKSQILDAAARVFARLGLHQARMDDIVEESGLSKGTLYWYFKSKDEIIAGILENLFSRELHDLQSLLVSDESTITRLIHFAEISAEDVDRMFQMMPITFEFYALAFRQGVVQKALRRYFQKYLETIIPLFQQGIDRGEFRPIDPEEAALSLGAIFEGMIVLKVYDPERIQTKQHLKAAIQIMLDGLRTKQQED